MRIHEFDGFKYIKLGDLDHMLRMWAYSIYDKYDVDADGNISQKDGTKGLKHDDNLKIQIISAVMNKILKNVLRSCDTNEEAEKWKNRVEGEFYGKKYVIQIVPEKGAEPAEPIFFRGFCPGVLETKMREEGKSQEEIEEALDRCEGIPAFGTGEQDAWFFEDHWHATNAAKSIRRWDENLKVEVIDAFRASPRMLRRIYESLMKKIESKAQDEEEEGKENDKNGTEHQ